MAQSLQLVPLPVPLSKGKQNAAQCKEGRRIANCLVILSSRFDCRVCACVHKPEAEQWERAQGKNLSSFFSPSPLHLFFISFNQTQPLSVSTTNAQNPSRKKEPRGPRSGGRSAILNARRAAAHTHSMEYGPLSSPQASENNAC